MREGGHPAVCKRAFYSPDSNSIRHFNTSVSSAGQDSQVGMRPLASSVQEQRKRGRALRRKAQEKARLNAAELHEFHELKSEHGAIAALYEFYRRHGQRFVAKPLLERAQTVRATVREQVHRARTPADWVGTRE